MDVEDIQFTTILGFYLGYASWKYKNFSYVIVSYTLII